MNREWIQKKMHARKRDWWGKERMPTTPVNSPKGLSANYHRPVGCTTVVLVTGALLAWPFIAVYAKPLTIEQARITVTGHDVNRPDPFPGQGKFSWAGNIQRLASGELMLVHSAGYYHVSFAQPRLFEDKTRRDWLAKGWPLDFSAPTGGRSMATRSVDNGRSWGKPKTVIDLPLDDGAYGLLRCRNGTLLCFINVQASWYGFPEVPPGFKQDISGLNTQQCVVRSTMMA